MTRKKFHKKVGNLSIKEKENTVKQISKDLPKEEEKEKQIGAGRPKIMTDLTLQKLKLCFAVGMTDEQACYFSQISTSKLYQYQQENPEFLEEKGILKDSISLQARLNIGANIKAGDSADSKWWLMMRDKDFMNKLQFHNGDKPILDKEDQQKYQQILKNNKLL